MVKGPIRVISACIALFVLGAEGHDLSGKSVEGNVESPQHKKGAVTLATAQDDTATEQETAIAPKGEMGKEGFEATLPDGGIKLRLQGYLQVDSRTFIGDEASPGVDQFLVRRARPILQGTAGKFNFRITADFSQAAAGQRLYDAYAEYKLNDQVKIRAGKFKVPVGLERLRSRTDVTFAEASLPTNLSPNRDVGIMASGTPFSGFTWELGLFNGVQDNGRSDSDPDGKKEWALRLFTHPFSESSDKLKGLGVGIAGTWGEKEGSLIDRQLGDYRAPSQARVFRYRTSSVAFGSHWRVTPQGYFYAGPFGLLAEYIVSAQEIRNNVDFAEIENKAWEAQFCYVLTGQDAGYRGWPTPAQLDPRSGNWGAWEIAVKVAELTIDDRAFPLFADPVTEVSGMENYGVALHGYLSEAVRLTLDYEHTRFKGGADRDTEQVVFTRIDYKF